MRLLSTSLLLLLALSLCHGQSAMVKQGQRFERTGKNLFGDQHNVVDGVLSGDGTALVYVLDLQVPKVVRLDAQLKPTDELVLKDHAFDGATWNGVAPIVVDGSMHCLLVSSGKKETAYAIGNVTDRGAPTLTGLRRIATSALAYVNDPSNTLIYRPQPDPILLSQGLQFAQNERISISPDGEHYLLSNYSYGTKGNKQIWFSYLDKSFNELWSGLKELPYPDASSRIHQISMSNDGTIHVLAYHFHCASEEQMKDKLCHELHFSTLADRGNTVKDLLVEKDFVTTARFCERDSGRVSLAVRYGALTGQPGLVISFDPLAPKLKTTALVDQRDASIRKTKLMAYGSIDPGAKKTTVSRTAKVPDEIIGIMPDWNNGVLVLETFLDNALEVPMDGAIAMRRLCGDIRVTNIGTADTVQWQTILERAFMTTAGRSYEGVSVTMGAKDVTLLYDHTPKGLDAILASGMTPDSPTDSKGKKDKLAAPAEAGVLKMARLDTNGTVTQQGTAVLLTDGLVPCPTGALMGRTGEHILVRAFDRSSSYQYTLVDPTLVGK